MSILYENQSIDYGEKIMKSQKNGEKPKHIIFFRRSALFVTCSLLFIALVQIVGATPPSDMTVSYNLQTHELQVTITHPVSNQTTHYIHEVKIVKNGCYITPLCTIANLIQIVLHTPIK